MSVSFTINYNFLHIVLNIVHKQEIAPTDIEQHKTTDQLSS